LGNRLRINGQGETMAMRYAAFRTIKAVAARLSMAALALALGIGATSAIFHPRLFDAMRPSASASGFACKKTAGDTMPAALDIAIEPQRRLRQSLNNNSGEARIELLLHTAIHRNAGQAVQARRPFSWCQ
jgi:hypothetical protein